MGMWSIEFNRGQWQVEPTSSGTKSLVFIERLCRDGLS